MPYLCFCKVRIPLCLLGLGRNLLIAFCEHFCQPSSVGVFCILLYTDKDCSIFRSYKECIHRCSTTVMPYTQSLCSCYFPCVCEDVSRRHGEERHFNDLMREKLVDKCSIPPAASGSLTTTLNSYFKSLASQTLSTPKPLSLREFVNCFSTSSYKGPDLQLPKVSEGTNKTQGEEVEGSSLEVKSAMEEKQGSTTVEPVRLHPKLSGDSLVRLGSMLFKVSTQNHVLYLILDE